MHLFSRILAESVSQALQQLWGNRLRTFLSLLGIMIGIVCIIGVLSAVDSLESSVRGSVEKLGDDIIYVQKISWTEDPGRNYFKYLRRPAISIDDYEAVKEGVSSAGLVCFSVFLGNKTARYRSSSVERVFMVGVTYEYADMFKLEFEKGRYFSPSEYHFGANKVIIGHTVAEELFGNIDPIGRQIVLGGRKMEVIAVIEKSGESLINVLDFDEAALISFPLARKVANLKSTNLFGNSTLNVKLGPEASLQEVKDEVTGALRAERRLKPREEENFSLNQLSILTNLLDQFFQVLNLVGIFIGIFAIIVGLFSVANIMFVSVRERTRLIGIKKAIGAKQWVILLEFLVESVLLCLVGGAIGLLLVQGLVLVLSELVDGFQFFLSIGNMIIGLLLSVIVGVLAGIIPAFMAARLDPVVAMRK